VKIRELLSDPTRWTQHVSARNVQGDPVHPRSEEACAWCLLGAMHKCYDSEEVQAAIYEKLVQYIIAKDSDLRAASLNDRLGYDAVMEVVTELDV
jgi:hypothetical protein